MTQLVRPVHTPSRTVGDGGIDASESASAELTEMSAASAGGASHYELEASPSIPGWTVVSAALCPVLLVGGWVVGGALQQTAYSPMQQTMSVLAGQPGTHPWVMTGALFLVGTTQLVTAAGLRQVGTPARVLLVVTGLCTFGVASSPEPVTGPSPIHLAFAVSCVFTTAIWPIFVARRPPAPSWTVSNYGCAAVTVVYAALSGWVLYATFGGGDLGFAERVASTALALFPLIVALSLRRAAGKELQDARSASS